MMLKEMQQAGTRQADGCGDDVHEGGGTILSWPIKMVRDSQLQIAQPISPVGL